MSSRMYSGRTRKSKGTSFGRGSLRQKHEGNKKGKVRYRLHGRLWMCPFWISVADKPGGDKRGEGVVPEEKLCIIKLR